jgi:hypothetical protein
LAINEQLQDKLGMAGNYGTMGAVFASTGDLDRAIENLSKAQEILEELEGKTGYHNPLIDRTNGFISVLKKQKEGGPY